MNVHSSLRGSALLHRKPGLSGRIAAWLGHKLLNRIDSGLDEGTLEVVVPDGSFRVLGGRGAGPKAQLAILRWRGLFRMALRGSVGAWEGYDARHWLSDDPVALFDIFMRNRHALKATARARGPLRWLLHLAQARRRNSRKGAKANILAHYDLGNDFYAQWLDKTMSYSSALFAAPMNGEEPLEAAQKRKVAALGKRLKLAPASRVLEIGCGWGFLASQIARKGHWVTAISLSPAQLGWAREHHGQGEEALDFCEIDYRDVTGEFDAIASVEMVEAVGIAYWPDYLSSIARLLKPGGRAAIQYITIDDAVFDDYAASQDFIQAHIFPGGALINEPRFRALAEARGLRWEAPSHFALDYAETLRRWRVRFDAAVEEGRLPKGFDERFVRLWRFYLMYCEGGFRSGGISVAQVTLVKD